MIAGLTLRFLRQTRPRVAWRFARYCAWGATRSIRAFDRRRKHGRIFPPFLFLSITNACQLQCTGCWVSVATPAENPEYMSPELIDKVIADSHRQGNRFFGIMGGEPLLHPQLLDILARHPDCYFQLFTNGHALSEPIARRLADLGNITPLISIEGSDLISDQRRGRLHVLSNSLKGLRNAIAAGLVTGVATSLCRNNIDDLLTEPWLDELIRLGALYVWFYAYRPVGASPARHLALTAADMQRFRRFIVDMRPRKPIGILDAYWDADGHALCPMAIGLSHHINPWGDIEPCPVLQFAAENIRNGDLAPLITHSEFLDETRRRVAGITRGCILLEHPDALARLADACHARDTSHRTPGFLHELHAMTPCPSHATNDPIPERHWAYRLAKKRYFYGFGAYG